MKHSPGCNCCTDACEEDCYFPCTGSTAEFGCKFCGIDIQLPTPDSVGKMLLLGDEDCPTSAPCWACYIVFDRYFLFSRGTFVQSLCQDFNWQTSEAGIGFDVLIPRPVEDKRGWACWYPAGYDCPYDNSATTDGCPSSKIVIADHIQAGTPLLELSGAEWNGSCGKLTLVIAYTVFEFETSYNEVPIGGGGCEDPKYTAYKYTFELNYCTCEDLTAAFTYVSVDVIDSCAGAVADPCNMESATIKLYTRLPEEQCSVCPCLNCEGYISSEFQLAISGPVVNGTFIIPRTSGITDLVRETTCFYSSFSSIESDCGEFYVELSITCLECDKFTASISITQTSTSTWLYSGRTEAFSCGESPIFASTHNMGACNFAAHTIQLSFVSA